MHIKFNFAYSVLDAWGKVPSAILSGNLYDFGGFSECFHIDINNTLYKTQYCLGHAIFDKGAMPSMRSYQHNDFIYPNILPTDNEPAIKQRMALPQ